MSPSSDPPVKAEGRSRPLLRVVRGAPTDTELAAVVTVLAAATTRAASDGDGPAPTAASRWSDRGRSLRRSLAVGPDAWRTSMWPG